jgi:hypothetical protein
VKIDLHVHIKRLSKCAKMEISSLVPQLLANNIYGVCPFDHNYYTKDSDIAEIQNISDKITVFKGTEINIKGPQGNKEDYLLISSVTPQFDLKNFEIWELVDFINKNDALTVLANPFRRRDIVDFNFGWFVPDAVEIFSTHIKVENREKIKDLANKYGMKLIVNSDAHKSKQIGQHYFTEIPDGVKTCEELKWIIKTNRYLLPI